MGRTSALLRLRFRSNTKTMKQEIEVIRRRSGSFPVRNWHLGRMETEPCANSDRRENFKEGLWITCAEPVS